MEKNKRDVKKKNCMRYTVESEREMEIFVVKKGVELKQKAILYTIYNTYQYIKFKREKDGTKKRG